MIRRPIIPARALALTVIPTAFPAAHAAPSGKSGKVRVFLLAGQSNMEGKGFPRPMLWQLSQEKYRDRYKAFIKAAWGGRALAQTFLPPSSMPDDTEFEKQAKELNATNRKWNEEQATRIEQQNEKVREQNETAEKNLANLIRDVRREFGTPDLPIAIGQMGHGGDNPVKEGSPSELIRKAQAAVAEYPEFKDTVACVRTAPFWDMEADAIYNGPGGWSKDVAKWRQFDDDRGYHYDGSPWFFTQAGRAFGEAMIELTQP